MRPAVPPSLTAVASCLKARESLKASRVSMPSSLAEKGKRWEIHPSSAVLDSEVAPADGAKGLIGFED
jgi:hypothetical protein